MTAIGINATALKSPAGSFVSVTVSQVSASGSSDFGKMLADKYTAGKNAISEDRTVTTIKPQKTEYSKEQATTQNIGHDISENNAKAIDGKSQKVDASEDTSMSTSKTPADETVTESTQVAEIPGEETDAEELLDVIEILNTLMQGIAGILETTLKELQGSFEELHIEPGDIVQTDTAAQIVLYFNQATEISDMLFNNDMLEQFNEIKNLISQTLEDFGFTEVQFSESTDSDLFKDFMSAANIFDEEGLLVKPDIKQLLNGESVKNADEAGETNRTDDNSKPIFTVEVNRSGFDEESEFGGTDEQSEESTGNILKPADTRATKSEIKTTLTPAESFATGIENAMKTMDIDMPVAEGVTVRDIVYQLVDAVKVNITPENTSLEMNLNPESLGRVNLSITQKNGVMTAQITTENQVSKEALESQLQILKDNIEAQGVKVEAIEVTVSSFSFSDSKNAETDANEQPRKSSGRKGIGAIGESETPIIEAQEEKLQREVMIQTGSTVSYTA